MRHPSRHIFEHNPDALREWCVAHGMAAYRAEQVLDWVYVKRIADPAAMSNLSKADRVALARGMMFLSGNVVKHQSATDGTQKLLVEWGETEASETARQLATAGNRDSETRGGEPDGDGDRAGRGVALPVLNSAAEVEPEAGPRSPQTECVMIPSEDRNTACISSQVGCPVGCRFCASGIGGLEGNLSAGRIVEQVWRLNQLLPESRISNVVFMGMGEPLANLSSVVKAVRTICTLPPGGMGISARKVTISTVGLPKAIERLAEQLDMPVTLALSLHAPNDDLRRKLIPWAEYTTIKELLAACQKWFDKTGREITLEYTVLRGINDLPEHAVELSQVAKTLRANVNLIRYNEVDALEFKRPRDEDVREFQRVLKARNVNTHIRRSRGRDIAAACGQLRHEAAGV
ncbi:MAG: 23S rRNA (adenine(2503)-C(2))-methyltransferase RlmN [Phycisphaerales bacterium]